MLRFLLLEDNAIDAQLIQRVLMKTELKHEVVWVKTRADFLAALTSSAVDLILADYNLPGFNGTEALEWATQNRPEIPFILVSGSLGEELAIEMLKQGATDYVLKQRLERLVLAVKRALQEAQEQRQRRLAERMLVEQKQLLELIATGHPLDECLTAVCNSISQLSPHTRACFLLTDAQRQTFPRSITSEFLPSFGEGLKDAPINDLCIGTCGEAVYRGQPITCADIANDDRWSQEWRNLCVAHGILACHSKPVIGIGGLPLGSLMLCLDEARQPTEWEYQLADFGTQVASIAFERDRSNLALRGSEERFRAIVDQATAGIALTDPTGQFMLVNQRYCDIVGYSKEELLQKRMQDITHLDDLPHNRTLFNQLIAEGREFVVEKRYIRGDGSEVWVNNSVSIIRDASGNPQSAVAVVLDISDRQQAEQQLRESRAFLTHITDVAPIILYVYDLCETRNVWSNNNLALVLGYTPTEVQAMGADVLSQLLHPEDAKRYPAHFERLRSLQPDEVAEFEYRMRHKDGSWHWLSSREMAYLQNDDGTVKQIVGAAHDITARRQANERLHLLYETTSELLATEQPLALMNTLFSKLSAQLDLDYYFNFLVEEQDNQRKLHLTHHSEIPKNIIAQTEWIEFGQDICGMAAQEQRQIVLNQTQIATYSNAQLAHLLGITAYACQPLMVRGRLLGTLSFASLTRTHFTLEETDLLQSVCEQMAIALERSNLTRSIQQQAERLEEANRVKDEFLAVLSHELRTPLNPILGWTRLLRTRSFDQKAADRALDIIERNARLQTQLIEDLLDVSRILQGKVKLEVCPVNLVTTIEAALETVRLSAEAKSIQIQTEFDSEVGLINGDANRLQQVIWNLLSNAVKFTPSGGQVEVRLNQVGAYAQIQVSDTGQGIGPEFLPYIFEYFRQADSSTTRHFGGLGLGLAIARYLVELHGGTVEAESPGYGMGATFTVQLPLMLSVLMPAPDVSITPAVSNLNGVNALIVDDEADMRNLMQFILEEQGAKVRVAASANEALQYFAESKPDILISDIGMPEMDGYVLIRQIRATLVPQGTMIPAIALTAYAGEVNQRQALSAGFQLHLAKPIEPEQLIQAVAQMVTRSFEPSS
jgi:PAS domain S-box-containing protein